MAILRHLMRHDGIRVDLDSTQWGHRVVMWTPHNPGEYYIEQDVVDPQEALDLFYAWASPETITT